MVITGLLSSYLVVSFVVFVFSESQIMNLFAEQNTCT